MPDNPTPLVTIITPSLNMGQFLRETIESVLMQDYPRIEYIVMDGGSRDDTLSILGEYAGRLTYSSEPDQGTADAVNRGVRKSGGAIVGFLNADDTYLPGAVSNAVEALLANPEVGVVYGEGYWVNRDGQTLGVYPTGPYDPERFRQECFVCQPASFFRREAFESAGMLDTRLAFTFDYDLWIRMARHNPMLHLNRFLATSRMHSENKTVGQRRKVLRETLRMLRGHYGYIPFHWIHSYGSNLVDGRDQFFEPSQPSIVKYLLSLWLGLRYNRRYPLRFFREWASVMTLGGLVRRWRSFFHPSS